MPTRSPPILDAKYDDVGARVEKLGRAFTATRDGGTVVAEGWVPPPPGEMDLGRALVRVFERMAKQAIARVNRIPDRTFLAFLNRTGAEPAEARPARVPLTFSLVSRGDAEPIVPAGTRVGALRAPGDTREIVFETDRDLFTTRAKLVAAFVRQPDGDRLSDRTALATGAAGGTFDAFDSSEIAPHFFYVAAEDALGLPAGSQATVTLTPAGPDVPRWQALLQRNTTPPLAADPYYATHIPAPPLVAWTYWNGSAWAPLPLDPPPGTPPNPPSFAFKIPADIAATSVNGRSARWLRGQLLAWPAAGVPALQGVEVRATSTQSGLAPDHAMSSAGRPIDLSLDFYPLGAEPRLNDSLLVACDAALARRGASITVQVTYNPGTLDLTATDAPAIAWEISTQTGFTKVVQVDTTPTLKSAGPPAVYNNNAIPASTTFTVPATVAKSTINGVSAVWLRIRLASGSFGRGVRVDYSGGAPKTIDDGYRPPILRTIRFTTTATLTNAAPLLATRDDHSFANRTLPFTPFTRSSDVVPTLYLGFDRAFTPRNTLLYFQVAPLDPVAAARDNATAGGSVAWDYWTTGNAWAPLPCEDETRHLASSGLLHFVGPGDFGRRSLFGRDLFWLRLRLVLPSSLVASPPPSPKLGRVLTNTVNGFDAAKISGEILGSGDGRRGQSFPFAARPVLEGQRVEVREAAAPSGEAWVLWDEVPDFYSSGPKDRHYTIDRAKGVLSFGDGRRGLPPPKGLRNIRAAYATGGGALGNKPAGTVTQLKTTVPYVDSVTNHEPASGGADREPVEELQRSGPRMLRHGFRAVTAEDFEDLAFEASPAVARTRAITPIFDAIKLANTPVDVPATNGAPAPGGVVLLIATSGAAMPPAPGVGLLRDVEAYIRARSGAAVGLSVVGPMWIEVSVTRLVVTASSGSGLEALRARIESELRAFFHPITGNTSGQGWAFGELPHESDVYRLVTAVPGVDRIGALEWTQLTPDGKAPPQSTDPLAGRVLIYPGRQQIDVRARGGF